MSRNICTDPTCRNFESYCRIHLTDEPPKEKNRQKEYAKVRKEYLKEHPVCEADCKKASKEIHHKRGRVGDLLTDPRYFMAVCSGHHRQIEDNPVWAKEQGYSESRLSKSEKQPI